MTYVIVQVSDTHLSPSHAYFDDNWQVFVTEMQALQPDLVINTGDFSFNGPDVSDDIQYARQQADRLGLPYLTIPGNHDVGEPGDNPRLKQPVNDIRLNTWKSHFGNDRFIKDIEDWRLIGINSELLGSGLDAEHRQWEFIEDAFAGAGGRMLGLFSHKPLYQKTPNEDVSKWSILPEPRARLFTLLTAHKVHFVASGHLHRYRYTSVEGLDLIWCPTTAFITPSLKNDGCIRRVGYLKWTFDGHNARHEFIEPSDFINHDMSWRTKKSGTTISLPPNPLAAE